MSASPSQNPLGQEQPLVSHLIELRDRVLRMVLVVLAVFLVLFPFANDLYTMISVPLRDALPAGSTMISTKPIDPFLIPFKLSLQLAVFVAVPFILYQFWAFVAPGLYKHEKRLVMPLLVSSTMLFYLGMAFAYFIVFPLIFTFISKTAPEGIQIATDMGSYLDFVMTLFFAFGAAFEVPIATIILVWMGMTTPEQLRQKRPYVIVGAFVVGMLLTPPDIISQTLLALPMWVLFELGIIFSGGFVRKPEAEESEAAASDLETTHQPVQEKGQTADTPVGSDIDPARDDPYPDRFVPLTDEEMEAELDEIEAQEIEPPAPAPASAPTPTGVPADPLDEKLKLVQSLRAAGQVTEVREILYEVLQSGNEDQRMVARNILSQLDSDD